MKIHVRNYLLMGVVLFGLIFLTGCGTLERLVNKDGTTTTLGDFIGGDTTTLPDATTVTSSGESMAITLYFADSTGQYLVKEQRVVPKTEGLARETVNQWLKGPAIIGTGAQASVPTTTKLLDIAIKENVVIVDLSEEFLKPSAKVSPEVALYGLVNTLTEYSTIKQVQLRIQGKPLANYGAIDASRLVARESLVKGEKTSNTNSNPIVPSSAVGSTGQSAEPSTTNNDSNSVSPSSINLFDYPPSSI